MKATLLSIFQSFGISLSDNALIGVVTGITFVFSISLTTLYYRFKYALYGKNVGINPNQNALDDQLDQLSHTFNALSQEALRHNNESFLTLAKQSFSQLQSNANSDLKAREQSFANLIKPIQQSIQQTDSQLKKLDTDRKVTEVKLGEQINNLLSSQHSLQSETRNLVTALRRPEVRGQWGELTLRRLVELAGMSEYCDFDEQVTINTVDGQLRPDMIIRLPNQRDLVVDVKTPLDAYISANEAKDDVSRSSLLEQHCRNLKQRIKELAQKKYWEQFSQSPDFVILFIPGDQFLSAALDIDKNLLEFALERKILLSTPTSLVGLLRAIAYGWNQDSLSKNSEEIKIIGEGLYQRLITLTEHLNKLGKNLDQSLEQFNKVVGSFEGNTLPAARKLAELGVGSDQELKITKSDSPSARQVKPK